MVAPRKAATPRLQTSDLKAEGRLGKTDFASFHYLEVLVPLHTFPLYDPIMYSRHGWTLKSKSLMGVPRVCNLYLQSSVKKGKGKEGTVTLQGSELVAQACTLSGG